MGIKGLAVLRTCMFGSAELPGSFDFVETATLSPHPDKLTSRLSFPLLNVAARLGEGIFLHTHQTETTPKNIAVELT